jgi:hypothetical protein
MLQIGIPTSKVKGLQGQLVPENVLFVLVGQVIQDVLYTLLQVAQVYEQSEQGIEILVT